MITWDLEVLGARSLKEKRRVVKSLKERMRNRFNVSIAETSHHDLWQRAELTACVVATDRAAADRALAQVDGFVAAEPLARIIDSHRSSR